jgi:hypothetical protein
MYHSISFYDTVNYHVRNTWDDWHLIPSSRPVVVPPPVKSEIVEIPGANGVLDLSRSLTGFTTYGNREGSFEFIVANGYSDWCETYSAISSFLHGKTLAMVLDDDSKYLYDGTFSINNWASNSDGTWSNITIDYSVGPYKYERDYTTVYEKVTLGEGHVFDFSYKIGDAPTYPRITLKPVDEDTKYTEPVYKLIYSNTLMADGETITKKLSYGTYTLNDLELIPEIMSGTILFDQISDYDAYCTIEVIKGGL